jgi:hypothetical protein
LLAARDARAAGVGCVGVDRVDDVVEREAVAQHLHRIEIETKLLGETAEIVDIGDAGNGLQRRDDDPVLKLGDLHQIFSVRLQRVAVDFAGGSADGIETGLVGGGQTGVGDFLQHLFAGKVNVALVVEQHRDQREPERAARTHAGEVRRNDELPLERSGDLLLDLLGGKAGNLRRHLHFDAAEFRIGLDGHGLPRIIAVAEQQHGQHGDQRPLVQANGQEPVNH